MLKKLNYICDSQDNVRYESRCSAGVVRQQCKQALKLLSQMRTWGEEDRATNLSWMSPSPSWLTETKGDRKETGRERQEEKR